MPLEELCHLIEVSSHKRFRMAKAQELQALARGSFGFAMAGDVFSTMIRLYAKHLDFLKQQVREMDRKIAEIMDTLDTPITTITGIGPTLGAYILSEIGDISRFSSAAKLAAYAGIDPTMRQSGEYNGVRNRMSKRGSPYLRHAIWLAASSAVLHDPALKLYFQIPVLCGPSLSAEEKKSAKLPQQLYLRPSSIAFFSLSHKRPTFAFTDKSGYTLGSAQKIAHSGSHAETGVFRMGALSLPSDRFAWFGNPAWPGLKTANFAAFGSWPVVLPKNAESLRDSDALMRVAVPRRRGPAGLRIHMP